MAPTASNFRLPKPTEITATWWGERDGIGMDYLALVREYRSMTMLERRAWDVLARETARHAEGVRAMFNVVVRQIDEPYASAREMCEDMRENGRLIVSGTNCEHPYWTPEQNVAFRIVHDGLGHYLSGGAFSWQGELDACGVHFRLISDPDARRALFTECIGQIAAYYENGEQHAPQVCGFLPEHWTRRRLHE